MTVDAKQVLLAVATDLGCPLHDVVPAIAALRVRLILADYDAGEKLDYIVAQYGCSKAYVSKLAKETGRPARSTSRGGGRPRKKEARDEGTRH